MATPAIRRFSSLVKAAGFLTGAPKSHTAASVTLSRTANAGRQTVANRAAGQAYTLPAAKGTGDVYKVMIGTLLTGDTTIAVANATDVMKGGILINDIGDTSAGTADFFPTASTSDTITFANATGAGKVGDYVELTDLATGVWAVRGVFQGMTDPATPFSATIS
jgi:hypothetical protein